MDKCWMIKPRIAVLTGCLENYAELAKHTITQNKQEYCLRHGYDLKLCTSVRPAYAGIGHAWGYSWSRMAELLDLVEQGEYDWIWTVGCDTLITNLTIKLESIISTAETPEAEQRPIPPMPWIPDNPAPGPVLGWIDDGRPKWGKKHLLICGERFSSMQADSFLVRGSHEAAAYLYDILCHHGIYCRHPWVEQQTMMDLREKHAAITHIVPQWMLNSYDYRRWHGVRREYQDGTDCYGNRGQWQYGDFLIHWPAASLPERLSMCRHYQTQVVR